MTRNLKALGLALVAAFAMSAVVASAAHATAATFSWDSGTVTLKATEDPTGTDGSQRFSTTAGAFTCSKVEGSAKVTGTSAASVTGEEINYWDAAISTTAQHKCTGPFGTEPVIEPHGCHFKFNAGTTEGVLAEGLSTGTVDIIGCEVAKPEITINAPGCIIHVTEQNGVGPVTYKTVKTSTKEEITIIPTVNNIASHHEGFLCGGTVHTDTAGTYTGNVTVQGWTGAGGTGTQTNVTVT